jgi:alcohol dehydrogenase
MENFIFQNKTKIIFGKGTEKTVGDEVKKYGNRIMLIYGGGSIKKRNLYRDITDSLNKAKINFIELSGVKPNPSLNLVRKGIEICKNNGIEFILAVGGGSVIDTAKAVSLGVRNEGDVWDFFKSEKEIKDILPIGTILTIPASGSETSTGCVITNEEGAYKRFCDNPKLRPVFAILNPVLTFSLPPFQTACGAVDIIAHIIERYITNSKNVELTDRLSEAALKTVIGNIPLVLNKPNDYSSRAEIMWAGTIAHNDILGTGREEDWASHLIEHELSGIYDIAHGEGLSIIIPAWMEFVYRTNISRFAQFAVRVFNIEQDFERMERTAAQGISALKNTFKNIGLPISLREAGIVDDKFELMARKCTESGPIGSFKKLYEKDIVKIFTIAK